MISPGEKEMAGDPARKTSNIEMMHNHEHSHATLSDSEELYRNMVDLIPDGILVHSDGQIVFANSSAARIIGVLKPDDLIGKSILDYIHPDSRQTVIQMVKSSLQDNTRTPVYEEVLVQVSGTSINVDAVAIPINYKGVRSMLVVYTDITARKNKERLMMENLAIGEFALNHSMNELIVFTLGKIEELTGSMTGFFQVFEDDGATISLQIWSDNTLKHHREGLPQLRASLIRELTVPVIRGDKTVALMGVGNKPADYDQNDMEIAVQLTNLAWEFIISKRLEEALLKSEQYARALLDAIPDLIFRLDRDGTYLDYKAAKEDLHNQSASIIGKNNRELTPPDFARFIETKIQSTLDHQKMEIFEYQLMIPDRGLRDFEARMVPSGTGEVTAITRDITDRKKIEGALKKKIAELEWFNQMMIGRELKMIDLKNEINILANKLGEEDRYVIHSK